MTDVQETPVAGVAPDHSTPAQFDDFPISPEVRSAIAELGFTAPTPVQSAVVRQACEGRDLVVQSKTGSGKTSAFGIPLIEKLEAGSGGVGAPKALVLVPTRELAHQVAAEVRALAAKKGTRVLAVYGGVPMGRQIAVLKAGVDVIVGTPGRLLDHIRRKNLSLATVEMFVLDEADEMLSMGFWDDVTALLGMAPATRQTMMFSATLPYEVAKAAAQYLKDPARVDLSGDTLSVDGIENHIYHVIPDIPKPRQLLYILENEKPESAIIFCNTRTETGIIAKYLTQSGFIAEPLSGNLKQKDRERVMGRIKARELRYMVATDIAARGIDITDLSHVFNYSLPEFSEVFLHRVGRTGRIGKMGTAVSLVDGLGLGTLSKLEREFGVRFTEKKLPPEEEAIRLRSARIMKDLSERASVVEVGQHLPVAQEILQSADAPQVVAFLLKQYFNNTAADADRRARAAAEPRQHDKSHGDDQEPQAERPQQGGGQQAAMDGDGEAGGSRRRRRRRRRRGGGGGERVERVERGGRGERGERGERGDAYMETMDAAEALAGEVPMAAAAVTAVAEEPVADHGAAPAPSQHRGNGNGAHETASDGLRRLRVNIGFDDGFKGRGAVAKKISALAGLNEGIITEVESRRDHAVLKATPEIAELVMERVDGAQIGKKIVTIHLAN